MVIIQNNNDKKLHVGYLVQLNKLNLLVFVSGFGNHGRIIRILSKELRYLFQKQINLICFLDQHSLHIFYFFFLIFEDCIYIQAICFIGGNPSR